MYSVNSLTVHSAVRTIKNSCGCAPNFDGITGFDIIGFDDVLKSKYSDYAEGESMCDFIERKFGENVVKAFKVLIDTGIPITKSRR